MFFAGGIKIIPMICIRLDKGNILEAVNKAVSVLQKGGIVAYPTETFYGLGVKFDMPGSLKKLYEVKGRPREKALPVIIGEKGSLFSIVPQGWLENISSVVKSLMDRFWPGPLTFLLPAKEGLSEYLTADTGKIAVRIPGESFALRLAKEAGFPVVATSANRSGMPPAVNAETVIRYFGDDVDLVIDGGETPGGLPSTIVDASGNEIEIAREGAIRRDKIEELLLTP